MLSRAPGIAGHVALMPDAHLGKGATVGSVIPTFADTLIPAAVGVDIGCGMIAVRTNRKRNALPQDPHAPRRPLLPLHPRRRRQRAQARQG